MNDDQRRRFESIFQLYSHAWNQFNTRRTYEWQICISLWTALSLAIAGVVNASSLPVSKDASVVVVLICSVVLIIMLLLQYWFVYGVAKAHKHDREMAVHFGDKLQELSDSKFLDALKTDLKNGRNNWGKPLNWSSGLQLGFSVLLSISLIAILYAKVNAKEVDKYEMKITTGSPISIVFPEALSKEKPPPPKITGNPPSSKNEAVQINFKNQHDRGG